jgi:aryl-alcohol dehydrogenase-like predicted oxidoreductase
MHSSRRQFLMGSFGAVAAGSLWGGGAARGAGRAGEMERRRLGRTGLSVGVIGFGAAEIGYGRTEQGIVDELLNGALDQGLDAIDTAECYLLSEEQIGKAVATRRDEYALFTKVGHWPELGWSAAGIAESLERSLKRLKTDHVDVVHLHSCGVDVLERGEAIEALDKAREAGKTRFIGYSGDSEAARWAVDSGRFDTLMISLSIADQEAIAQTLPRALEKDMGVIVKRGIANAVWRYDGEPESDYHKEYWRRMRLLDYDFCKDERRLDESPRGAAGVALRFTLGLPGVHTTVIGTTNPRRFAQNLALAAAGPLPADQVAAIRARWAEVAQPDWVGQI